MGGRLKIVESDYWQCLLVGKGIEGQGACKPMGGMHPSDKLKQPEGMHFAQDAPVMQAAKLFDRYRPIQGTAVVGRVFVHAG